jgi:hypothetical protein
MSNNKATDDDNDNDNDNESGGGKGNHSEMTSIFSGNSSLDLDLDDDVAATLALDREVQLIKFSRLNAHANETWRNNENGGAEPKTCQTQPCSTKHHHRLKKPEHLPTLAADMNVFQI